MNDIIQTILVYALPVLFAITLHEAAHAYAAKYFGDSTAYMLGRMSLDPLRHVDPLGTIFIPIVLYYISKGTFVFGYAKPVPIDFGKLRNPKKQMAWVALAGPAANFVMALLWMVVLIFLHAANVQLEFFLEMAQAGILVNTVMFVFNLVPIPPLDGGRILTSLLPIRLANQFARIEPYGIFIVIALIYFRILPVMYLTNLVLRIIVSPISFLLN